MARRSTIEKLPEDVRRWLERALTESGFSGYNELESLLRERGYVISKSAIHRYGQKIERRYGAIRAATEAARMLTEGAADDQDARSEAVIALIQTELFESIVQLQEAEEGEVDPKERVALLSKVAKNVATLSRASVNLKSSSLKYGPERSRQPATPRKLPVRGTVKRRSTGASSRDSGDCHMTKSSGVILNAAGGGPEGMSPMDGRNNLAPVLPDTSALDAPPVLLPYQQRWVADTSPLKVIEKSRRTGITWAEASDNVLTAASSAPAGGMNVYYIAYNQDMTVEYIQACAMWARAFNYAASEIEEGFWEEDDDDKHIRTYTIKFPDSGFRIVALSSRPSNLRGRQGIIVIDEAAFHEQLDELLKAALAMLIWGKGTRYLHP